DKLVTGVQTCALPISMPAMPARSPRQGLPSELAGDVTSYRIAAPRTSMPLRAIFSSSMLGEISKASERLINLRSMNDFSESLNRSEERRVGKESKKRV